jgi:hypothetical protein
LVYRHGLPNLVEVHAVVGEPIDRYIIFEGDSVKSESIEKFHSIFLTDMEALFERRKLYKTGFHDKKLKIV